MTFWNGSFPPKAAVRSMQVGVFGAALKQPPRTKERDTMNTIEAATVAGRITRACKQCRAPLTGKRPQARYCNSACRLKAHRRSPANAPESVSKAGGLTPQLRL
jgi:hypothetical protein